MPILIIIGIVLFLLLQNGTLDEISVGSKPISEVSCGDVARVAENQTLQNMFGAQFDIMKVRNTSEHSRTSNALRCIGTASLSNGTTQSLVMRAYDDGGDRMYEFRSQ